MEFDWKRFRDWHPRWFTVLIILKRLRTKVAVLLVSVCMVEQVYNRDRPFELDEPNGWVVLAIALILAGLSIRLAALGVLKKKEHLATTGVYSLCRNPLYLGSMLLAYGFCILLNDVSSYLVATLYFATFYPLAIAWEEARLEQRFGEVYRRYCATTPRLVPLGRFRVNGFSWRAALQSGGLTLIVAVCAGLAGVEVMAETLAGR
ncbi:MAG: isoprenylcysteine carboxylmethyltransferase family protein [Planctomycetota bacterium]|nr:MAG: isoprenylcysteine carboxylmethyltransferase family protein [Planctomycetota bacterium]